MPGGRFTTDATWCSSRAKVGKVGTSSSLCAQAVSLWSQRGISITRFLGSSPRTRATNCTNCASADEEWFGADGMGNTGRLEVRKKINELEDWERERDRQTATQRQSVSPCMPDEVNTHMKLSEQLTSQARVHASHISTFEYYLWDYSSFNVYSLLLCVLVEIKLKTLMLIYMVHIYIYFTYCFMRTVNSSYLDAK